MVLNLDLTLESPGQVLKIPVPGLPQINRIRISRGEPQASVFF